MRHTAATLLLIQGVDPRTTQAIMGWFEAKTAQRHTHVVDVLKVDAALRMEGALWSDG